LLKLGRGTSVGCRSTRAEEARAKTIDARRRRRAEATAPTRVEGGARKQVGAERIVLIDSGVGTAPLGPWLETWLLAAVSPEAASLPRLLVNTDSLFCHVGSNWNLEKQGVGVCASARDKVFTEGAQGDADGSLRLARGCRELRPYEVRAVPGARRGDYVLGARRGEWDSLGARRGVYVLDARRGRESCMSSTRGEASPRSRGGSATARR